MIHMTLNLEPQPKQRPRFNRSNGRVYTSAKTSAFESSVRKIAQEHISEPIKGAVSLSLLFVHPRLKSEPKRQPLRRYKATRPDLSNLIKSVEDGLQGVAFLDDAAVVKLSAEKVHAGLDEQPHIEVTVREIDPYSAPLDLSDSTPHGGGRERARDESSDVADERIAQREARRVQNRVEHRIAQQQKHDQMRAENKAEEYERCKQKLRELTEERLQARREAEQRRQTELNAYSTALLRRSRTALRRMQAEEDDDE